jgi:hypothetical protein
MRKLLLAIVGILLLFAAPAGAQLSDDELLDAIQQPAFQYFWSEANPANGLIRDRSQPGSPASIASVGFGLSAICVGVDHGWVSREDARQRVRTTLNTFYTGPQGNGASGIIGYKGFFYHFLDMNTATRFVVWDNVELSSIDSALLMAGILDARQYFAESDTDEVAIREMADSLESRMDWTFFRNNTAAIYMGWKPGTGFAGFGQWHGYNESMIMNILALGSPSHPVPTFVWTSWTSSYNYTTQYGQTYIVFPPLFGHQYSHCWIDFRNINDLYGRNHAGLTYFENSRRATLAQQAYCIDNPEGWVGYNDSTWGLTACDGPSPTGYNARGAPPEQNDDGTIAPTAVAGSLPFAWDICLPALHNFYNNYPSLWGPYGFRDAFNLTQSWYDTDYIGIDEGPIVLMIENHRNQSVWNRYMQIPSIQTGLARAGFLPATVAVEPGPERSLALLASEPSPLTGRGAIRFRMAEAGVARLVLFDARGREARVVFDEKRPAGDQSVAFDPRGLAAGVYLARLTAGAGGAATGKYVLLDR